MGRSSEYNNYINSPKWKARSLKCQSTTGYRCVMFPWVRSRCSHHLTYNNFESEIPFRDIVPLCNFAHWIVHLPGLWRWSNKPSPIRVPFNLMLRFLFLLTFILGVFLPEKKKRKRKRRKKK